jgi:curved DNA-binding protein CbpA
MTVRIRRSYKNYADEFSELHLLPTAPREVVDAAYRALSRLYHPDQGRADPEAMYRLNDAYREIIAKMEEMYDHT